VLSITLQTYILFMLLIVLQSGSIVPGYTTHLRHVLVSVYTQITPGLDLK
jgi:hypothetical protein